LSSPRRVALVSLGCKVNQSELEGLKALFYSAGYQIVPFPEEADVYVIHTCTVTHISDRKSRQLIRRAIRANPRAVIAVTGCYAQVAAPEILSIPGVDVVVGTKDRCRLVELVEEAFKGKGPINGVRPHSPREAFEELPLMPPSRRQRTRALVKIQEGCENFCTYCIVPLARGPLRSRPLDSIRAEVQKLIEENCKEIVLTGVHIGAYGRDLGTNLATLLKELVKLKGLTRLRLGSLDPWDFTPELIQIITEEEVICPHYHIPLQSGDNRILKSMGRPYTSEDFLELIFRLRNRRPRAAFTSDVMVGFPGEGEEEFQNTIKIVKEAALNDLHVFSFSPRPGTPAASFPHQVPPEVKKEREKQLLELARWLLKRYQRQFLGETAMVLVEREIPEQPGIWLGRTDNYLLVAFPAGTDLKGELLPVKLQRIQGKTIWGELEEKGREQEKSLSG